MKPLSRARREENEQDAERLTQFYSSSFEPVDPAAHERACEGEPVADPCKNCGEEYGQHRNGVCPQ